MLKRFFDPSRVLLLPSDTVTSFTGKSAQALSLPPRAVIAFSDGDLRRLMKERKAILCDAWQPFRTIYRVEGTATVITGCSIGGPNIAALVEELAAFGVKECVLWGYCGALRDDINIGDIVIVKQALREEGVSFHYLDEETDFVESPWHEEWAYVKDDYSFREGAVWSCDALYRETEEKISHYSNQGILGVEMETASFYSVCRYKGIKGIVFLVVSDAFLHKRWKSGFRTKPFKEGVKRLTGFMLDKVIR